MSKVVFIYRNGKTYTARGAGSVNATRDGAVVSYTQYKSREGIVTESKHSVHVRLSDLMGLVHYQNSGAVRVIPTSGVKPNVLLDIADCALGGLVQTWYQKRHVKQILNKGV